MSHVETHVDLSLEALLDEARARTGLADFGDPSFREPLAALLATYDHGMGLTMRGKKTQRRRLLGLLMNRLRVVDVLARHPEIHDRPIRRPLFLTGLPRTGTSALFNLLAADRSARPLLLWEGNHPDPIEDLPPGAEDPRLTALRAALEKARAANPGFSAIHDARADEPEECVQLLAHSMAFVQLGVEPLFSPYREDFLARDLRPIYDLYADLLRLVDSRRPGERWLLKTPAHLWALDHLLRLFPDATIVVTHRDPLECIPSYCSMVRALLSDSEGIDPTKLGPEVLEYLARSMERAMDARSTLDASRFVDVRYSDFLRDPIATCERIHTAAGIAFDAAVRDAMKAHVDANPQNKHGRHRYGLEEFGLDENAIRDRLARYLQRHPLEANA